MPKKIILAGASSVMGHEKIIEAFSSIGMDATFIEAPFIKKYFKDALDKFIYTENLPPETTAIPLSEYWLSLIHI